MTEGTAFGLCGTLCKQDGLQGDLLGTEKRGSLLELRRNGGVDPGKRKKESEDKNFKETMSSILFFFFSCSRGTRAGLARAGRRGPSSRGLQGGPPPPDSGEFRAPRDRGGFRNSAPANTAGGSRGYKKYIWLSSHFVLKATIATDPTDQD
ncbi:hypothetical protein NL676_029330 [Syzygium grande]|nr:hypothetical protein NL676_029330 [Syzygium grande]